MGICSIGIFIELLLRKANEKIIIFTNTDWHFYAHLLPIALTAKMQGYEVKVLTDISEFKDKIEQHGLQVIPISIKRGSINPFTDLVLLSKLISILNSIIKQVN